MSELLVTFGILTINWSEGQDAAANFAPFIIQSLKDIAGSLITVEAIQKHVCEKYRLRIPLVPLSTILRKACRQGYATFEQGCIRPNRIKLDDFDLEGKRADAERQCAALLVNLKQFAEEEFNTRWSLDEVEQALLAYVSSQAMPLLAATVGGEPFDPVTPKRHRDLVVNRFVQTLCDHDPIVLSYLETFVKGSMLANALYLPESLGTLKRRFGPTRIFLDTSLVLETIGYAESDSSTPVRELVELLRRLNASMCIFRHTMHEIEGILNATAMLLRQGVSEPYEDSVYENFLALGLTWADAERLIGELPARLQRAGIEVVNAPPRSPALEFDEGALAKALIEAIPYYRTHSKALQHDIDSLAAINRLRAGGQYVSLESCPALFVTTNLPLARESTIFLGGVHGQPAVPLCVHHHTMTTVAWLKDPAGAHDLPRKQMIAAAAAAGNPSAGLWRKYLAEAERLHSRGSISEDDLRLLRFAPEARAALMQITYGDSQEFTQGTIPEILDRVRNNVAAEVGARALRTAKAAQAARYSELAETGAAGISGMIFALAAAALVIGLWVPIRELLPAGLGSPPTALASTCVLIGLVFGLMHLISGKSLLDLARSLRRTLAGRIFKLMIRTLTPREDRPEHPEPPVDAAENAWS